MKTFFTRTLSGAVYLILIIGSILWGPFSFGFLFLIFLSLSLLEFHTLSKLMDAVIDKITLLISGILYYLIVLLSVWEILPKSSIIIGLLLFFLPPIFELFRTTPNPVKNISLQFFGLIYIVIPLIFLNFLFYPEMDFNSPSKDLVFGFFILIWINDTFAYITGMLIGKHLFFERDFTKKNMGRNNRRSIF